MMVESLVLVFIFSYLIAKIMALMIISSNN
jgi:hypothetical protein